MTNPWKAIEVSKKSKQTLPKALNASELFAVIFEAFPEISDLLIHSDRPNPHLMMKALFRIATKAIRNQDANGFVKVFGLASRLIPLIEHSDVVVRSAFWVSFLGAFDSRDPAALDLIRNIDVEVRKSLYLPFTLPHSWIRERRFLLLSEPGAGQQITVDREAEATATWIYQGAGCRTHFAIVRIRVESLLEDRCLLFQNKLDESHTASIYHIEEVIRGVKLALSGPAYRERAFSYLQISLLDLRIHEVDTAASDIELMSKKAVEDCVNQAGIVEL